ncbi:LppU/SCO3897 family protein [Micromonospora sp. LOL_023]|uniref:LppU/SCO3897 family protein n=1 Tax=Micromonospora sp. LOL_023 TaxID=3345418 RepID=UPI003A84DFBF
MSSYGPPGHPGAGQPDDPAGQPGYPPPGQAFPPPPGYPSPGEYPAGGGYPPPGAQPVSGGGYPDPTTPYQSPYQPGGQPGFPPPTSGGGGYPPPPGSGGGYPPPPPPGWGPPPPGMPGGQPPKKSRVGLIIGLVIGAVVLLVLCGCGGLVAFAVANGETSTASGPVESPSVGTPAESPDDDAESGVPPTEDGDTVGLIVVGDCVVNDGTDSDAVLRKVACEPGSYEVLARIPLTTDTERCDDPVFGHEDTDTTYVNDSDQAILDYVLCMKEL